MNQEYKVNGAPAPVVLIQKIVLTAPNGRLRRTAPPLPTQVVYYEEIGVVPAGQVQTAAGVNDTWFAPPPPAPRAKILTPFGTIELPVQVTSGRITMKGQIRAFPENSLAVKALLANFKSPRDSTDPGTYWYYVGSSQQPHEGPNVPSLPAMTPGILPSSPGTDAANVWNNLWVACETATIKGKTGFAFHQEVVQFTTGTPPTVQRTPIDVLLQRSSQNNPFYVKPHPTAKVILAATLSTIVARTTDDFDITLGASYLGEPRASGTEHGGLRLRNQVKC